MKFIGAFFEFSRRVLNAVKAGGLPKRDVKKLDNLLMRTGKRNTVLAKGILTALSAGGASDKDVKRFGRMLRNAEDRIMQDKEPFTKAERKELSSIFKRAYISAKTTKWFQVQVDELLAEEITEFIAGSRRVNIGIPKKKSVSFERKTAKKTTERKKISV
jgi:3-oxoacyl-ACP reductase-like protein